jgi:hypothetical protein
MGKKAKTDESRRRCQLYAGSNLNTEKEIKTDVIKALSSVDKNYEENIVEVKILLSKKVIIERRTSTTRLLHKELRLVCTGC